MKSQHQFSNVPRANIPRSSFNLSHGHKTVFDADLLVPILGPIDIIPGDTFNVNANFFVRLASPSLFPIMDNMYLETFFFFVPNRILWDNWEKFCGAQDDPADNIDFTIPVIDSTAVQEGTLGDFMGIPDGLIPSTTDISALPFRAFRKIYNDWFRDENLQDSLTLVTDDGPDTNAESGIIQAPPKRGKRHDYFTSCLPWPQKGDAVALPLGTQADVGTTAVDNAVLVIRDLTHASDVGHMDTDGGPQDPVRMHDGGTGTKNVFADLSTATSATINELRLAFQTQRLLERDARSGTRYVETLAAHWGISNYPDARLQRPEFLGGGSNIINMSSVAQTTYQGTQTLEDAKGALSGIGTVSGRHGFTKSFVEHGILLGLVNVRGDISYSQGLERYWSKATRYDFYYPVLSMIGEQAVLNKEIWHNPAGGGNDNVFGYQERYAEHRYLPSRLSNLFRVDATGTLAAWHLSEDFAGLPTLDATFIESNTGTPLDRAISVPAQPQFLADFYFDIKAARPMPTYGTPGNLDHF